MKSAPHKPLHEEDSIGAATVISPVDVKALFAASSPPPRQPREGETVMAYAPSRSVPTLVLPPQEVESRAPINLRRRAQPFLIPASAFLGVGVIAFSVWAFAGPEEPVPVAPKVAGQAAQSTPVAAPIKDPEAAALAQRESLALRCLASSTQSIDSAARDELLRTAVTEFEKGRLAQSHEAFQRYVKVACDRATLEATLILARRLDATVDAP